MRASTEGSISESVTGGALPFVRLVPGSLELTVGAIVPGMSSAGGCTLVREISCNACLKIPILVKRPPTDSVTENDPGA